MTKREEEKKKVGPHPYQMVPLQSNERSCAVFQKLEQVRRAPRLEFKLLYASITMLI